MHAHDKRVPQASHEILNPPETAEPMEMSLSDAQLATFWKRIVENRDAALGVAARSGSKQSAEDIVHTAALLFVENAQRSKKSEPFPASEERFRRTFLKIVKNHARDCVRDSKRPACPVHSHWGIDPDLFINGRNLADRELDTVFARNDEGKYDAPAPRVRRAQDDLDVLHYILRSHMQDLSQTEREIIDEAYFQGLSRDEIAARRGISLYTYDNHRKAACAKLRDSMTAVVDFFPDIDLPDWYDRVGEMSKRHAASQRRRASRKKGNRSSSERDRSNFEGEKSNFERDQSNSRGNAVKNTRARDESMAVVTKS